MRCSFVLMSVALSLVAACGDSPGADDVVDAGVDSGSGPGDTTVTLGAPIVLTPEQYGEWVWISMPEMHCSDGTAGGFAVNFTTESRDLVIYLQGGGICYDALTCSAGGAATSVGNDPLRTSLDGSIRDHHGIFDRVDATNPFRNSNFVVVPHCTGDHHTGNRLADYNGKKFEHVGYTNITRMLERVVPTFPDATRVALGGFSAGGVGITANYHQLASAFASVGQPAPYLVIDAGPFMRQPFLATLGQAALRESWGLDGTIGTFCASCLETGFHDIYRVNQELHPGVRSSLLCSYDDSVVRLLYGVLNKDKFGTPEMRAGLDDLADWGEANLDADGPSLHRVFYYAGTRHGALQLTLSSSPGLVEFLAGQLGTSAWPSVRP